MDAYKHEDHEQETPPDAPTSPDSDVARDAYTLYRDVEYGSLSAWEADGIELTRRQTLNQLHIGMWVEAGNKRWGDKYDHAMQITGLSYDTLAQYVAVVNNCAARVLQMAIEHADVIKYSHLRRLKAYPEHEQIQWARLALEQGWTADELKFKMDEDADDDNPNNDVVRRTALRKVYDMNEEQREALEYALTYIKRNPNSRPETPARVEEHTTTVGDAGTAEKIRTQVVVCPYCDEEFEVEI